MPSRRGAGPEANARKIKQGRGQGVGRDYTPWFDIHQVLSRGLSHRYASWTAGRIHHLLSNLEYSYSRVLEWSPVVIDFREQFPLLPLEETRVIAHSLDIRHPTYHGQLQVMTTDFLITVRRDDQDVQVARTVKYQASLDTPRVLQKFEIERQYWAARNVDWAIITENDIPWVLVANMEIIHQHHDLDQIPHRINVTLPDLHAVAMTLTRTIQRHPGARLRDITDAGDKLHRLAPGTSLTIAYHLIASRQWEVDMQIPIDPSEPLALRSVALRALIVR